MWKQTEVTSKEDPAGEHKEGKSTFVEDLPYAGNSVSHFIFKWHLIVQWFDKVCFIISVWEEENQRL